ncbi:uncharacterized protein LOC101459698 isoform X1 [Ceratitis capitata]|uniref:uncharacterized protein LOC101459698 isoform X1 n=1 Tax=Ceratitis capitata TaxID=7213 RepID=UPI000A11830F|nr:uncharacterized protein LOC101459698 isoform X1 [Ceratitis capitata]
MNIQKAQRTTMEQIEMMETIDKRNEEEAKHLQASLQSIQNLADAKNNIAIVTYNKRS